MRYFYKSILLDLIFIVYGITLLTNKYLNLEAINIEFIKNILESSYIQSFLSNYVIQTGVVFVLYGIILIISYLIRKETLFGQSRIVELITGITLVLAGPAIIYFNSFVINYFNYMLAFFALLHGVGKFIYNPHQGDIFRAIQFAFSAICFIFGLLICDFFKQEMFESITNYYLIGLGIAGTDILLLIVSCFLPRDDFEDTSVKIKYSSFEDRITMKNKRTKVKNSESSEIDNLFDNDINR